MHEAAAVEVAERGERLPGDLDGQAERRRSGPLEDLLECQPVDEFEDEELAPLAVDREVEDLRDVRVAQPARRPRLAQEAVGELGRGAEVGEDDLDHPHLVEQQVAHLVDRAHPPLAQLGKDRVFAFEDGLGGRHGWRNSIPGAKAFRAAGHLGMRPWRIAAEGSLKMIETCCRAEGPHRAATRWCAPALVLLLAWGQILPQTSWPTRNNYSASASLSAAGGGIGRNQQQVRRS